MALTTYIPGMAPGRSQRNIVVFIAYLVCFPLVPFIFAYAVFSNYNRISDRLAMRDTPGFTSGGGAKPAAVTLVALLVTISVVASLSVAPFLVLGDNGSSDAPTGDGAEIESDDPSASDDEVNAEGDDANGGNSNTIDEGEFIGESDSEVDMSEEEKEEATAGAFEHILVNEGGYEVTDARMEDGVIYVEYRSYAEDREELEVEMADFAGYYMGYDHALQNELGDEYEGVVKEQTEGLDVTILDYNDVEQGSYYVEAEWAQALYSDDMSGIEFEDRILETLELSDEFGDADSDDQDDAESEDNDSSDDENGDEDGDDNSSEGEDDGDGDDDNSSD